MSRTPITTSTEGSRTFTAIAAAITGQNVRWASSLNHAMAKAKFSPLTRSRQDIARANHAATTVITGTSHGAWGDRESRRVLPMARAAAATTPVAKSALYQLIAAKAATVGSQRGKRKAATTMARVTAASG